MDSQLPTESRARVTGAVDETKSWIRAGSVGALSWAASSAAAVLDRIHSEQLSWIDDEDSHSIDFAQL